MTGVEENNPQVFQFMRGPCSPSTAWGSPAEIESVRQHMNAATKDYLAAGTVDPLDPPSLVMRLMACARLVRVTDADGKAPLRGTARDGSTFELEIDVSCIAGEWIIARSMFRWGAPPEPRP